ncbi:cyclodeaminase/cyclohydrolase family protein [Eubacterium sp.]|uniref:cyclodeaminase/cyclohydrolase family protein n=1 Tax=Eubacterium sp. TaxID=142586 RepID=UPI002FCA96DC
MKLVDKTCREFTEVLYSKAAVPGGGGAAALTAALGTALAGMVANLTTGKKKYAEYEEDIQRILVQAQDIQDDLLDMIDQDAENFSPLAKAYSMPSDTPEEKAEKAAVMEKCTITACSVPIEIVKTCHKAIKLHEELLGKGSILALSDVGVGVECLRAAMVSGWMNVQINIKTLQDRDRAMVIEEELKPLIADGIAISERVSSEVQARLS